MTSRGPGHREGRDRNAARQRFKKNQAEGIRSAREDEDVGSGVDFGQLLACSRAEEDRVRVGPLESRARRSITDDDLGPGQIEAEKRIEVLLDRNASDRQEDGTRQAEIGRARMKQPGVDAARP